MDARVTTRPVAQVLSAIQALDLESVKARMMDEELGEGWSREYADGIETAYKTYLSMLVKYPEHAEDIMLSKDVDEFWHTHILQTRKYAEDCERVFGDFLHHNPHVGPRTAEDLAKRDALAEITRRLYESEFRGTRTAELAWGGAAIQSPSAAYSTAAINAGQAAYSTAAIEAKNGAYSTVAIQADNAAYSTAAIRAGNAAYSTAAIKAQNAAYSTAAIKAQNAAYSTAAIRANNAAYSTAAIRSGNAAYSTVAINAQHAAYSTAAIQAQNSAYSTAAISAGKAAYSTASVSTPAKEGSHSGA